MSQHLGDDNNQNSHMGQHTTFSEYLHGSMDNYGVLSQEFGLSLDGKGGVNHLLKLDPSPSSPTVGGGGSGSRTPATPNSSISSSSTEAAGEKEGSCGSKLQRPTEDIEKVKVKKKKEKKEKQPRFAFMTKSEVDHLEDGYRWRKYGQKAVKNSSFPRSYYRCTTPKCSVKKRVERSYQDPSTVVTTYEGQHNHLSPATLRGSTHIFATTPAPISSFRQDLFMQQQHNQVGLLQEFHGPNHERFMQNLPTSSSSQQLQLPDFGLLQDIIPTHNKRQ